MSNREYIQVHIPKELYDRIARFSDVEEAVLQDMTEWVRIMEDEERLSEEEVQLRFLVEELEDGLENYWQVSTIYPEDLNHPVLGNHWKECSQEEFISFVCEKWGLSTREIKFK